ncbi:MAG TPA: beta-galactosidase [Anaerolineales bacterium]|nr:beta-galactosidase [Anaerolineales bacterium]
MATHLYYGGDYNPEQWPPETWQEDARLMQAAGVNLVTLAVFAWAKLEPAEGQFDFTWLDQVIELLYAHGVSVDLATSTASPPPWLVRQYPEILPVTADGVTLWHGSRRHYCPHSQAYRQHAVRLVTALAEHYQDHPAIRLWHVDNEYACHISECFCDASVAAFRQWLQTRYGTLEELNRAWGTAFWSQHYSAWQEVQAPRRTPAFINPSQKLDWERFCSDSWRACFEEQTAILHATTPDLPVTTNFMHFHPPLDHWKFAAREDIVAFDNYPDTSQPDWMVEAGMGCDLMRSLGDGRPWLLMEQAPTHVNWRQRNATKRPGIMRMGSYQAIGRGADGILFFQWRASLAGAEKFHSAMLPHAGTDSRVWREVSGLGAELKNLEALSGSRLQAETAILFDWENWWALERPGKLSGDLKLLAQVKTFYAELFRRNISVDFAHPESDLSRYKLVIAPHLYLVSDRSAGNLQRYVEQGGTLLMTFFSGIVDPNDHVRPGHMPVPFSDMLGLWVEEFAAYSQDQANLVEAANGRSYPCELWSDIIHTTGAEVLGRYRQDYFSGYPAITRHRFGQGSSYYLGTVLSPDGLAWLLDQACGSAGVQPVLEAPRAVEVTRRSNGTHTWLFVLNHSDGNVQVQLPAEGTDLITNRPVEASLELGPQGVAIVQLSK